MQLYTEMHAHKHILYRCPRWLVVTYVCLNALGVKIEKMLQQQKKERENTSQGRFHYVLWYHIFGLKQYYLQIIMCYQDLRYFALSIKEIHTLPA